MFTCRAEIEKLQSERNELVKNLNLAESKCNQDKDKSHANDLQRLLDEKGVSNYNKCDYTLGLQKPCLKHNQKQFVNYFDIGHSENSLTHGMYSII